MPDFELIFEFNRAVAAIIPERLGASQLRTVYSLLPERAQQQPDLSGRWNVHSVLALDQWKSEQLHRKPMFRPAEQNSAS